MKHQLHPACAVWPEMPAEALRELADDIKANGLRDPLMLTPDGLLLDGRNRALACDMAGVEPTTVVFDGDPVLFSLSKNKHRRHMERDQIAMVAAKLVTTTQGRPSKEKVANATFIEDAAKASGVRTDEIKSAKAVLDHGTPEEIAAVKTGKAKLRKTATAIRKRRKSPPSPQRDKARAHILAEEAASGQLPPETKVAAAAGVSRGTAADVLREIRASRAADNGPLALTKAQERHIEKMVGQYREELQASFDQTVQDTLEEILAQRDREDVETIRQANVLIEQCRGRSRPPFSAAEYTGVLLRALHPDTSTPENRLAAFKLVTDKKLLLRDEGRIELRGERIPRTAAEWREAGRAARERRKQKASPFA